jgi:N-acylneuraminate cytidylyltransferase
VTVSASKRLGVIPARGGSKRLPRKNVIDFEGKPMLAWSIECAKASGLFERVYVSTEDEEIARVAQNFGAVWAPRSVALASDTATVAQVCLDLLASEEAAGRTYDTLVVLYATAPLRLPADIHAVVRLVEEGGADSALAATDYPYCPSEALKVAPDGSAELAWPDVAALRREKRPVFKVDVGSTYAVRVSAFRKTPGWYIGKLKITPVPRERAVDIDTAADLDLAHVLYRRLNAPSPA